MIKVFNNIYTQTPPWDSTKYQHVLTLSTWHATPALNSGKVGGGEGVGEAGSMYFDLSEQCFTPVRPVGEGGSGDCVIIIQVENAYPF